MRILGFILISILGSVTLAENYETQGDQLNRPLSRLESQSEYRPRRAPTELEQKLCTSRTIPAMQNLISQAFGRNVEDQLPNQLDFSCVGSISKPFQLVVGNQARKTGLYEDYSVQALQKVYSTGTPQDIKGLINPSSVITQTCHGLHSTSFSKMVPKLIKQTIDKTRQHITKLKKGNKLSQVAGKLFPYDDPSGCFFLQIGYREDDKDQVTIDLYSLEDNLGNLIENRETATHQLLPLNSFTFTNKELQSDSTTLLYANLTQQYARQRLSSSKKGGQ